MIIVPDRSPAPNALAHRPIRGANLKIVSVLASAILVHVQTTVREVIRIARASQMHVPTATHPVQAMELVSGARLTSHLIVVLRSYAPPLTVPAQVTVRVARIVRGVPPPPVALTVVGTNIPAAARHSTVTLLLAALPRHVLMNIVPR
ncbi:MAG: hypothetical protein FVQ85_03720 [Planctomycetes bacterium]|nr:hypothetical protein [Planctomycetota bacterium]